MRQTSGAPPAGALYGRRAHELALLSGQLPALAELLGWMWRSKHSQHLSSGAEWIDPIEAIRSLLAMWKRGPVPFTLAECARCLTLIVLSCRADSGGSASLRRSAMRQRAATSLHMGVGGTSVHGGGGATAGSEEPRNPVVALQFSGQCTSEQKRLEGAAGAKRRCECTRSGCSSSLSRWVSLRVRRSHRTKRDHCTRRGLAASRRFSRS